MNIFIDSGNPNCCCCGKEIVMGACECLICGLARCSECKNDDLISCKSVRCSHCNKTLKTDDERYECECGKVYCIPCRDGGGCWEHSPVIIICSVCGNECDSDDAEECQECTKMICPSCISDGLCFDCQSENAEDSSIAL